MASAEDPKRERIRGLIDEISSFRWVGPDAMYQNDCVASYRRLATAFVALTRSLGVPEITEALKDIDTRIPIEDNVTIAWELDADLQPSVEVVKLYLDADGREEVVDDSSSVAPSVNQFVREGDYWDVTFCSVLTKIKKSQGMGYIAILLERRGEAVDVRELETPGPTGAALGGDKILDAETKADLRAELKSLAEDRRKAEIAGNQSEIQEVEDEVSAIKDHLNAATGMRGHSRRHGDEKEDCRNRVGAAIRRALKVFEERAPRLYEHLVTRLKTPTGAAPQYMAPEGMTWFVSRHPRRPSERDPS